MKKIVIDKDMSAEDKAYAENFNAMIDQINEVKESVKGISLEEVNTELKNLSDQIKGLETAKGEEGDDDEATKAEIDILKEAIKEIKDDFKKDAGKQYKGVAQAILDMFEEKGIKSMADVKKLASQGEEIELKADNPVSNTSYTGDYSRTQAVDPAAQFPRERPTAFLRMGISGGTVVSGKNLLLWTVGAFTETVGYAAEMADITTGASEIAGSTGTATDKTRKMAKIAARMIMSAEVFEDLPQFAQRCESKLMEKVDLWLDQKIWDGDGVDGGALTQHIYGVKTGQCTALDTAAAAKVEKANEADLVDACATQAEEAVYVTDTVWMTPKRANKLRRTKDTTGQYVVNQLITGELVMGGHRVIKTTLMQNGDADSMLVGSAALIQLWIKRNVSSEILRVPKTDTYEMYVYSRAQVLVEDNDIVGLVYVEDVDAALEAITKDNA